MFAELGGTVLIWPDKVWYRPDMGTFGSAEPSWSGTVALQRSDDSSGARADSVAANGIDTPFRVGDAVTFSGFSTPEDNGTYIIRAIAGAVLVFDPDTFSAVGAVEHITVTRRMPMALHACTYANRIWACAQDTVWCTKLGDPLSWYWYEADENGTVATAAWSVLCGYRTGETSRKRREDDRSLIARYGRALSFYPHVLRINAQAVYPVLRQPRFAHDLLYRARVHYIRYVFKNHPLTALCCLWERNCGTAAAS